MLRFAIPNSVRSMKLLIHFLIFVNAICAEMMHFLEECAQAKFNDASFDDMDADTEFSFYDGGIKREKY